MNIPMLRRTALVLPFMSLALAGCVDRGDWKPAAQIEPRALNTEHTLAPATIAHLGT